METSTPTAAEPSMESVNSDILRLQAVLKRTGLARSTLYRLMASAEFPHPVRLAKRAVGWYEADVVQWKRSRPTARSHDARDALAR